METLQSPHIGLQGNAPHTPPYTPHSTKHRFERADSPASSLSIQPTETSSPAKKTEKASTKDDLRVTELVEGDAGYITDIDVVYPEELEEAESETDDEQSNSAHNEPEEEIADRLLRLACDDDEEAVFERKRKEKRLRKRRESRIYKRSHSQSVKSDSEAVDKDAMADHDFNSSARRLRRRVNGPTELSNDTTTTGSLNESGRLAPAAEIRDGRYGSGVTGSDVVARENNDVMDVDDSE